MEGRTRRGDKSIELKEDRVTFRFPGVHSDAELVIEFRRTPRALDDEDVWHGDDYGRFSLYRVVDYQDSVRAAWNEHGGVFMPMYQSEAMWINLQCEIPMGSIWEGLFDRDQYPMAVKLGAGASNALTGEEWVEELNVNQQDYAVTPYEPNFDGICIRKVVVRQFVKGVIKQFVPMPLGKGLIEQEKLTEMAKLRTLEVVVYPMKRSEYEKNGPVRPAAPCLRDLTDEERTRLDLPPGELHQRKLYEDRHGIDAWDTSICARLCVYIVNSVDFLKITGCRPPGTPWKREDYRMFEVPWKYSYGGDLKALYAARRFAGRDSVKLKKGEGFLPANNPVTPKVVKKLNRSMVREGVF